MRTNKGYKYGAIGFLLAATCDLSTSLHEAKTQKLKPRWRVRYTHTYIYMIFRKYIHIYIEIEIDTIYSLVGGFNHLEKYEFVNGKDDIPYMKWRIKVTFQTTNQRQRQHLGLAFCISLSCRSGPGRLEVAGGAFKNGAPFWWSKLDQSTCLSSHSCTNRFYIIGFQWFLVWDLFLYV
jgi:hypothetical protein